MRVRMLTAGVSAAAAVGLVGPAPVATAETVFNLGGTGAFLWGDVGPWGLPYTNGAPEVNVNYPALPVFMDWSISRGADMLLEEWATTPGDKTAVGVSQGALVISEVKRRLLALPEEDRPSGELTFIGIADPSNPQGLFGHLSKGFVLPILGVTVTRTPETPWDTIYITREYDGFADFPDRPGNVVAVANALLGVVYVHSRRDYADVDLATVPDSDRTSTTNLLGGTTTTYLIRTEKLPLVQPLRDLGVPESAVNRLESHLKPVVDAGYARNDTARESAPTPAGRPLTRLVERLRGGAERDSGPRLSRLTRHGGAELSPRREHTAKFTGERRRVPARLSVGRHHPGPGAVGGADGS